MSMYPKFIIEGDSLILSKVEFHHQLVTDKTKVKGGGWFKFRSDTNTFIFFGSSFDFGKASLEDVKSCVDNGKVFSNKLKTHTIAGNYNFYYSTGSETVQL